MYYLLIIYIIRIRMATYSNPDFFSAVFFLPVLSDGHKPLSCCVSAPCAVVGDGPDRCARYPSAHNIFHVLVTVYFPVVAPLFKMCHFIVLISLSSLGSRI